MKKRLLSGLLILCMFISIIPMSTAFASDILASGYCGDDLMWSLDNDGLLTISGTGAMTETPWPAKYKKDITSVVIENGVTDIGSFVFFNCENMANITLPNSITTINNFAFSGCSSLNGITIPDSVTSIGTCIFMGCTALTDITIHAGITSISADAFADCGNLNISVSDDNPNYSSVDGVLFNKDKTLLIRYAKDIIQPEYTIPDSVTKIADDAFYKCYNLKGVTIPDSVTCIGNSAFSYCTSLPSLTIPDSVTEIYNNAFSHSTALSGITIPDNVTKIHNYVFAGCESLNITVSADNRNYSSFDGVLFNKDKTALIGYAKDKIQPEYTIPDSVTEICDSAFSDCANLINVTINNGVTFIGEDAFEGCVLLTHVKIPNSVTELDRYVFNFCSGLTSIELPVSLTKIGERSFGDCESLTDVYYAGSDSDWANITIEEGNELLTNATIHYNYIDITPVTKTSVEKKGDTTTITVVPSNTEIGVTILVALYKEDKFVEITAATYIGENIVVNTKRDYDKIKVMMWADMKDMAPVSKAENIVL